MTMTKLVLKWGCSADTRSPMAPALAALPCTSIVAYYAGENLLYVRDDMAGAAIAYLSQAGIAAEIVAQRSALV